MLDSTCFAAWYELLMSGRGLTNEGVMLMFCYSVFPLFMFAGAVMGHA